MPRAAARPLARLAVALVAAAAVTACSGQEEPTAAPEQDLAASSPAASATTPAPAPVPSPPAIEGLEVLAEDPSHEHQEGAIEYDRTPPLGGPHHPRWLACDVYDEPVPLELAVHSLEHGGVWLAYSPDLPQDEVDQLAELAGRNREYVLVAPQDGLDSRIVAVTWGAGLEASEAGDPRLGQFVDAFAGGPQGGEPGVPCRTSGVSLREARGLIGSSA